MLAKLAATLDHISDGRMILAVGTGDPIDRPEHDAFGFPNLSVHDRRAHLAETIVALRCLFRGDAYAGGRYVPRLEGPLVPPPVQPGGPPMWIGAQAEEVVRMAGTLADGWNGWGLSPQEFRGKVDVLAEEAGAEGREVDATWAGIVLVGENDGEVRRMQEARRRKGFQDGVAWAGAAEGFVEHLRALAGAGASWVIFVLAGPAGRRELIAERVLPHLP
jgi:alkanesulfonate monooxygenase SsuD/methylene tetrahydromethanopterin reductase-like flavin-dependent oxidoreductase (luciferase family)